MVLEIKRPKTGKRHNSESLITAKKNIETIRDTTARIRENSSLILETVKMVRKSGIIPELAQVLLEFTSVARDTAREIQKTVKGFNKNGGRDKEVSRIKNSRKTKGTLHKVKKR